MLDPSESHAQRCVSAVLGRELHHWDTGVRQGAVDFRALDRPTLSLEVKRITSEAYLQGIQRWEQFNAEFRRSEVLQYHWAIAPRLPAHGDRGGVPDLRPYDRAIEDRLIALERAGITEPRAHPTHPAVRAIMQLVGPHGFVGASPASDDLPAGWHVGLISGQSWAVVPDELPRMVNSWLTDGESAVSSLIEKLARSTDDLRHGFLCLDDTVPLRNALIDLEFRAFPSISLELPANVDRIWVGVLDRDFVWWFNRAEGWGTAEVLTS